MKAIIENNNYIKGFNAGYIVEKLGKQDFEYYENIEFKTSFMQGVKDGKLQARMEKGLEGSSPQLEEIKI
jgi:hypothetical protein